MNYQKLVRSRLNRVAILPLIVLILVTAAAVAVAVYHALQDAYMDAVVFVLIGAAASYVAIKGLPGQKYRRYCEEAAKLGDPEQLFAHLEAMQSCEMAVGADLRFDEQYLAWVGENEAAVRSAKDLVWGYLFDEVGQKHFGIIPLGSVHTYAAKLCFADGSSIAVRLHDQETVLVVLEQLKEAYPYMMLGYNAQLEAVFKKDPRELWSAAGYQNRQDETV